MKLWGAAFLSVAALTAHASALAADEGRFDAQVFRPLAAPRDLVMVPKSEVIGHLSPVAGLYWDVAFDPLTLAIGDTGKTLDVVGARLQVTPLLGVGLFTWLELTAAIPFVAWQTSDNLRSFGTEGRIKSSPHLGDIRLQSKVALPFFPRRDEGTSGFGLAVAGDVNLPTGDPLAFSSDGGVSGGAQIIADYRFNIGLLLASNLGVWIRPEHQFAGVKIGDMAQFGVAAEMYVVRRWGLSILGEVYGYPSLTKFPGGADQVPAEALLGVRWQTRQGITLTAGGSFGAACGFGAPAVRLWNSVTWQPKSSAEQEEINKVLEQGSVDPDHDDVLEPADECPTAEGPPENRGCPDQDRDRDGVIDREDRCPDLAAQGEGIKGCPLARVDGDTIVTAVPIPFDPDSADLSSTARLIVTSVRRVMDDTPTIREVVIEVHTDARESDALSYTLSQERAESIAERMLDEGIAEDRIWARGYGHTRPEVDDSDCLGSDEALSPVCKEATRMNRRVVFRIKRWGASVPWGILGGEVGSVLPRRRAGEAPKSPLLPSCQAWTKGKEGPTACVLPVNPGVLTRGGVLESAKDAKGSLPKGSMHSLPSGGVLPTGGTTLPSRLE